MKRYLLIFCLIFVSCKVKYIKCGSKVLQINSYERLLQYVDYKDKNTLLIILDGTIINKDDLEESVFRNSKREILRCELVKGVGASTFDESSSALVITSCKIN